MYIVFIEIYVSGNEIHNYLIGYDFNQFIMNPLIKNLFLKFWPDHPLGQRPLISGPVSTVTR